MNNKSTSLLNATSRTVWGWLALLVMSAILCGCSGDDPGPSPTPTPEPEPTPDATIGEIVEGTYVGYCSIRINPNGYIPNSPEPIPHTIDGVKLTISYEKNINQISVAMGALEGVSSTDRNYLGGAIRRLLLKADEPYPINSVEESDTEDYKQYTLQIKDLSTFPQGSFGSNYTDLEKFIIDISGSKATLSAVSMEKSSNGPGIDEQRTFTYLDMTLVREGEGPMPVAPLPEGYLRVNGVEYREIEGEENKVALIRIPDDMTHLTVPATVENDVRTYSVTKITLPEVNARNLKDVTLEANPLLSHIDIPQIENLYIQESPSQWAQKSFEKKYWEDYAFNGIEKAQTVYFNDEKTEHITFGEDVALVGSHSFYRLKQLKRVTFLGYPKVGEDAFVGTSVKRVDAKQLAPALKTGQLGQAPGTDIYIGGKKLTVLVMPDKIGSLSEISINSPSVEYLYIPKSSDVFLDYEALCLGGLKAAYIDKEEPPMRMGIFDINHPTDEAGAIYPGLIGPWTYPDWGDYKVYIPENAYRNYKEGSPWYKYIHSFTYEFWYPIAPFDFGKDKLPFPVK